MAGSKKEKLLTLNIYGLVQGIGFRPFIARIASEHNMIGRVLNQNGCVKIDAIACEPELEAFYDDILLKKPLAAKYISISKSYSSIFDKTIYNNKFVIEQSQQQEAGPVFPTPDFSICSECEKELFSKENRRFLHPFISCAECGPRYAILKGTPYDRITTTMSDFSMCATCESEYHDKGSRRMHAQTIACHDCGPKLSYISRSDEAGQSSQDEKAALDCAIRELKSGKIVAIKGIGGYHLACTPFSDDSVKRLRDMKGRENKPFAVMFSSLDELEKYCYITPFEKKNLTSSIKPIVLLKPKYSIIPAISKNVSRSSRYLGSFLPYTPLHHLILNETGPLVMTSANFTDSPIIKDDDEMLDFFSNQSNLEGILFNDRIILRRIDDSVVQCIGDITQIIRRARGYVPYPVENQTGGPVPLSGFPVLALGGQQKNTFCLTTGNFNFLSTDNGDLDSLSAFENYKNTLAEMEELLNIKPVQICTDIHPEYQTSRFSKTLGIPVKYIQHHYAHIASVMAEENLTEPVIGVAFDGTGYGTDGTIWGGEFLIARTNGFDRAGHLKTISLLGGDASVRDVQKIATCLLHAANLDKEISDSRKQTICSALDTKINTIESSSIGRIFDAVCSILNISHIATYEGECAIMLENEAAKAMEMGLADPDCRPYSFSLIETEDKIIADIIPCIREIVQDMKNIIRVSQIAYRFHVTIAELIQKMCIEIRKQSGIRVVALSGGVFQNRILLKLAIDKLEQTDFKVYINRQVPPNDAGISLGQAYAGLF